MTTQPDGTDAGEPEPIRTFRGQGWYNIWGVLLAVFIGLVGACAYWVVQLGFRGALENTHFGYEALCAIALGIVLIGRWSIPRLLLDARSIDPRSADLTRASRRWWFWGSSRRRR